MKSQNKKISGPILLVGGLLVIAALLVFSGGGDNSSSSPSVELGDTYGTPVLNIPTVKAELGDVSMKDGVVEQVFAIKNEGDGPLRIGALETSCMCTSASLEVDGEMGAKFGMPGHGSSSRSWAMDIPEGSEGNLHVYYDPNAHGPAGVGPFTREISFTTNDQDAPRASVKIVGVTVR